MKLTKEQILQMKDKFDELSARATTIQKDWEDFAEWLEENITLQEPNATRWYHCSERLPTEKDSSTFGNVLHYSKQNGLRVEQIDWFKSSMDCWWTPAPKNLVKPTPPDPFEEFVKEFSNVDFTTHNLSSREWLRKAYELGLSQPKQ